MTFLNFHNYFLRWICFEVGVYFHKCSYEERKMLNNKLQTWGFLHPTVELLSIAAMPAVMKTTGLLKRPFLCICIFKKINLMIQMMMISHLSISQNDNAGHLLEKAILWALASAHNKWQFAFGSTPAEWIDSTFPKMQEFCCHEAHWGQQPSLSFLMMGFKKWPFNLK